MPRDFLSLLGTFLNGQDSDEIRQLGKDAVREMAGKSYEEKIGDLRKDSSSQEAEQLITFFDAIKRFCLEEKRKNIFSIDKKEEERNPSRYSMLLRLVDSRLIHFVSGGRSNPSFAGRTFDIFCLDVGVYAYLRKLSGKLDEVDLTESADSNLDRFRSAPVLDLETIELARPGGGEHQGSLADWLQRCLIVQIHTDFSLVVPNWHRGGENGPHSLSILPHFFILKYSLSWLKESCSFFLRSDDVDSSAS